MATVAMPTVPKGFGDAEHHIPQLVDGQAVLAYEDMGESVFDDRGGGPTRGRAQAPSAVLGRDFDREAGPLPGGVELATRLETWKA